MQKFINPNCYKNLQGCNCLRRDRLRKLGLDLTESMHMMLEKKLPAVNKSLDILLMSAKTTRKKE